MKMLRDLIKTAAATAVVLTAAAATAVRLTPLWFVITREIVGTPIGMRRIRAAARTHTTVMTGTSIAPGDQGRTIGMIGTKGAGIGVAALGFRFKAYFISPGPTKQG